MIVQMLRPAGPDLARRWLAALLLVRPQDRGALVAEVERRVTALYDDPFGPGAAGLHVVHPPRQGGGYVERIETTYTAGPVSRGREPDRGAEQRRGA
ncbi:MAG: hypothetical protein IT437_03895 [Phycisphaerales bacterium]|nr:hypothetical protein [Phycisphaerales bacterium]